MLTNAELSKKFFEEINFIKKGYEIVKCEPIDNNKEEKIYWAQCRNGYSSKSYMIDYEKEKAISEYIKSVVKPVYRWRKETICKMTMMNV